jgi:hypothetical protein
MRKLLFSTLPALLKHSFKNNNGSGLICSGSGSTPTPEPDNVKSVRPNKDVEVCRQQLTLYV